MRLVKENIEVFTFGEKMVAEPLSVMDFLMDLNFSTAEAGCQL